MYMQKAVFCDINNLSLLIEFTVILGFFGIFCRIIKIHDRLSKLFIIWHLSCHDPTNEV